MHWDWPNSLRSQGRIPRGAGLAPLPIKLLLISLKFLLILSFNSKYLLVSFSFDLILDPPLYEAYIRDDLNAKYWHGGWS